MHRCPQSHLPPFIARTLLQRIFDRPRFSCSAPTGALLSLLLLYPLALQLAARAHVRASITIRVFLLHSCSLHDGCPLSVKTVAHSLPSKARVLTSLSGSAPTHPLSPPPLPTLLRCRRRRFCWMSGNQNRWSNQRRVKRCFQWSRRVLLAQK